MLKKRHLVGIAVSMAIFGMFGLLTFGGTGAVYAGVDINGPFEALATGPTPIPAADITSPFGVPPEDIGLPSDAVIVLPAVPVTVEVVGVTLSLAGFTIAEVSGGGGMLVGFVVGLYYAIDIAREQREDAQTDESPSASE